MSELQSHKTDADILILSDPEWAHKLTTMLAGHHLDILRVENEAHLNTILENHSPLMILIQSPNTQKDITLQLKHEVKERLREKGTHIIVSSPSIDIIKTWRSLNLPNLYFHPTKAINNELKERILNFLSESLWMETPMVGICGSTRFFIEEARFRLKNLGFRILPITHTSPKQALESTIEHDLRVVLWEEDFCEPTCNRAHIEENLKKNYITPIFIKAQSLENSQNGEPEIGLKLSRMKDWVGLVYQAYPNFKQDHTYCRDHFNGLYLPELFNQVLGREITLAERHKDSFSILKIGLQNKEALHEHYGFLFARELEVNLGLFVKNHTRSSDIISKNEAGDILILLSRTKPDKATLVGERLLHGFKKLIAFMSSNPNTVAPTIHYKSYTYGIDFTNVEDIMDELTQNIPAFEAIKKIK
ncbi:GGDEF domain-containing protein [bacterium]|nr:GGDEF domain-containing protein [bacterium]